MTFFPVSQSPPCSSVVIFCTKRLLIHSCRCCSLKVHVVRSYWWSLFLFPALFTPRFLIGSFFPCFFSCFLIGPKGGVARPRSQLTHSTTFNGLYNCEGPFFIWFHIRSSHMIYFICIIHLHIFHGNIWTQNWPAPNVSGFIAQLVERRTGIARSRVQTPLKSWIFFRLLYAIAKIAIITARTILHLISYPQFTYDLFHMHHSPSYLSRETYEPKIDLLPTSVAS